MNNRRFLVGASSGTEASDGSEAPSGIPPPPSYYRGGGIDWAAYDRMMAARPLHPEAVTDQWLEDQHRPLLEEEADRIMDYVGGDDIGLRWLRELYYEGSRVLIPIKHRYQYKLDYENSNGQRSMFKESECDEWLIRPINWAAYIRGVDQSRDWPRRQKHSTYYTLAHVAALSKRNETRKDLRGTHGARIIMELLELGERDALWAKSCSIHKPDPATGDTPMFIAARNSRPDVIKVFLSHPSTEHYLSEADIYQMLLELDFQLRQYQKRTWLSKTEEELQDDVARTQECIDLLKFCVNFRDELDPPWKEYRDHRNVALKYYHNSDTGVTQWLRPEQMEFKVDRERIPFFGIEQLVLQNIISRKCSKVSGMRLSLGHIAPNLLTKLTPHGKIVKISVSHKKRHSLHCALATLKLRDEYRGRLRKQVLAQHHDSFWIDKDMLEAEYALSQLGMTWADLGFVESDDDEETAHADQIEETPADQAYAEASNQVENDATVTLHESESEIAPESDTEIGWQLVISRRDQRRVRELYLRDARYSDEFDNW